jgi:hypothetical protein
MKQWLRVLASLLGLFLSLGLWAQTTTYSYTGQARFVGNFFEPCGVRPCANYPPASVVTRQFTTAAPLASNLPTSNIFPQVTSFSFNARQ